MQRAEITRRDSFNSQNSTFGYEPLQRGHDIRILQLHPGAWNTPITCDLLVIDLDSSNASQSYEAISYAWGDHRDRQTIICNGETFAITTSLFEALRIFRYYEGNKPRALWADNICINQDDLQERMHQVQLMRRIYTQATEVLIWLGSGDEDTVETALNLVCQIADRYLKDHDGLRPREALKASSARPKPPCVWRAASSGVWEVKTPMVAAPGPHDLHNLLPLLRCRWFGRLWALQEVALARAATAFWGNGQVNFELIGATALYLLNNHRAEFVQLDPHYGLRKSWGMLDYWTSSWDNVSFIEVLVVSRKLAASDPRDKVFGLLGLTASDSDPDNSTFIDPDYSLSMSDVYAAVARRAMITQKDLNVLAAVQHGDHLPDNWISWVPNWDAGSTDYLYHPARKTSSGTFPNISKPSCSGCGRLSLGDAISVRGIAVGIVEVLAKNDFNTPNWLHPDLPKRLQAAVDEYKGKQDDTTLASTFSGGFTFAGALIEDIATHVADYRAFMAWDLNSPSAGATSVSAPSATEGEEVRSAYRFYTTCGPAAWGHRLFVTGEGMLGLGPLAMREGDVVVVLFGGNVPLLLRPYGDMKHYRLVGECYVYDVMEGQAIDRWREDDGLAIEFHLY